MQTKLYTVRQAAREFGISEKLLRRWIHSGNLKAVFSGTRAYVRERAVLEALTAAEEAQEAV